MLTLLKETLLTTRVALVVTVGLALMTYVFMKWWKLKNYFKELNIPSGPTPFPFIGNLFQLLKYGPLGFDNMLMEKYGKEKKIVGFFEASTPIILCANPKLIKNVMIKDFNSFPNRRTFDVFDVPPADKFLNNLKDEEWKNVRSIVSATFTSGKLKSMTKLIIESAEGITKHIDNLVLNDQYFEAKMVFGCYTLDVISSCAFGVQTDAINEQNSEFIKQIKRTFEVELSPKMAIIFLFPKFSKYLSEKGWVEFFPFSSLRYLGAVIDDIIERRKSKKEYRDDFIQIMVDHEDNKNEEKLANDENNSNENGTWKPLRKKLTSQEILSQAILFLNAGYETTATTLQFIAYNLALNPSCQKHLCLEIDDAFEKHKSLSYDMVNDIPYLDMVINETLRMYPPALRLDRVPNTDYHYDGMRISVDSAWTAPIWKIHHDPEYYPDPDAFLPERFTPELKKQRENDCVYFPFGLGPRNCIGMRFALLEIKVILCSILSKYEFKVCDKTPMKLKFAKYPLIKVVEPIILKVSKRTD